jgi:hypothetical protein
MRARWVSHNPSPELPIVGQTQVASFLPGRFYFVSTIQLDPSSPLSKLTRSLELGIAYNDVPPGPDEFITQVFRCNKDMDVESFDDPLFERKYSTLSQAQIGHNETVDLFSKGKLKLSHIRRT